MIFEDYLLKFTEFYVRKYKQMLHYLHIYVLYIPLMKCFPNIPPPIEICSSPSIPFINYDTSTHLFLPKTLNSSLTSKSLTHHLSVTEDNCFSFHTCFESFYFSLISWPRVLLCLWIHLVHGQESPNQALSIPFCPLYAEKSFPVAIRSDTTQFNLFIWLPIVP